MALESLPKIAPALFSAEQDLIQIYNKKTDTTGVINASLLGGSTPPSGVSGAIQFSTGSAFGSDASNLFWDDTNNRLGIGTTTPLGILHLKRTADTTRMVMDGDAGQSKIITYRTAGLQRFGLYVNSTAESGSNVGSDFAIRAYNDAGTLLSTPVFIKRSTGYVGIGTTAPTYKFMVSDNSANDGAVFFEKDLLNGQSDCYVYNKNASTNLTTGQLIGTLSFGGYFNSAYSPGIQDVAGIFSQYTGSGTNRKGQLQLKTHDSSGMQTAMTINDTQLVGVGETSPTARLHVKGRGSTSATTSLLVQNSAGTELLRTYDDGSVTIGSQNSIVSFVSGYNNSIVQNRLTLYSAQTNIRGIYEGGQGLIVSKNTGITDLYPSSIFSIDSTTQGFLPPRMTTAQRNAIASPANGLVVFDTDLQNLCYRRDGVWVQVSYTAA
jgi:hypothetical protein